MKEKIQKALPIITLLLAVVVFLDLLPFYIDYRKMVIAKGVESVRLCRLVLSIVLVLLIILTIVLFIFNTIRNKKMVDYDTDSKLCKKVLDKAEELISNKPLLNYSREKIRNIYSNIIQTLNYYTSLEPEIRASGIHELSTSDEIIEKVLESMLKEIEHLLRASRVLYTRDSKEVNKAIDKCNSNINSLSSKTTDFVTSILNYMNKEDGESTSDILVNINTYKEIVLDEVSIIDKYYNQQGDN